MAEIKHPLEQFYEGNSKVNPAKGHLFESSSEKSLCGLKKSQFVAILADDVYESVEEIPRFYTVKQCIKCRGIALANRYTSSGTVT